MPMIIIDERMPFELAFRRFKRSVEKSGIPSTLRKKESYEKPTAKRKRERAAAIKRYAKKLQKEREARERKRTKY